MRSATSATLSSRSRPPHSPTKSYVVGVVRTRGAVPGATWPQPGTSSLAGPTRAPVAPGAVPDSGSKWVAKFLSFAVKPWDGWTPSPCPPVMVSPVCETSEPYAMVSLPFRDRKVGGSNPLAPTTLSPRDRFPAVPRRVEGACAFSGSGRKWVVNGAARRSGALLSAGDGGSEAPPATSRFCCSSVAGAVGPSPSPATHGVLRGAS
jgi:hypothetical protein